MYPVGMDGQQQAFLKHGKCFSLDFVIGRVSLLVWFAFLLCFLIMCLFLHSTCFGVAFFLHSLPVFILQRRFPKCKGKKLKSRFVLSSILSLSNVNKYFQFFCTSHAPHFSLQLWWTRWSRITENVLCGINKVEVIKT